MNWKKITGIVGGVLAALLVGLIAACILHDLSMRSINGGRISQVSSGIGDQVVFGEVQPHYGAREVVQWLVTNNGKKDLRFYWTVEFKGPNGWREVDYSIVDDQLCKEKVMQFLPLKAGETKQLRWSIEKDSYRFKYLHEKFYRLKAEFYGASGPLSQAIASVFSSEFEVNPELRSK